MSDGPSADQASAQIALNAVLAAQRDISALAAQVSALLKWKELADQRLADLTRGEEDGALSVTVNATLKRVTAGLPKAIKRGVRERALLMHLEGKSDDDIIRELNSGARVPTEFDDGLLGG